MENSDRQGEQGLPPQEQIGGSSSSSAPQNPKGESQDIFGTAPENFANTQLNPGEQYAPVGQTQGNPLANDSLLDQLPADSQALSQFLEGSQRAGAPPGGSSSSSADAGLSSGEDQGVGGGAGGDSGAAPGMSSSADDDLNVQPGSSGSMQESSDAPAADPPAASADDDLFGEGAADTGVTQLDSLQVQPEGVQEGENIEDLEEDLFGDGPAAVVPPASGGEGDAELEELFGDGDPAPPPQEAAADGDPAPPPQEAAALAVPVDPFAELDLDMEVDLREGMLPEEKASEGAADPFDDEEDLFGALSDADEDVMAEAVKIRKREKLKGGDKIALFNIPNILNWDALPFNADEELSVLEHMWHEKQDQSGNAIIQLKNPENSIRWRFQKDEHGGIGEEDDLLADLSDDDRPARPRRDVPLIPAYSQGRAAAGELLADQENFVEDLDPVSGLPVAEGAFGLVPVADDEGPVPMEIDDEGVNHMEWAEADGLAAWENRRVAERGSPVEPDMM
eukprot:g2206.t1